MDIRAAYAIRPRVSRSRPTDTESTAPEKLADTQVDAQDHLPLPVLDEGETFSPQGLGASELRFWLRRSSLVAGIG